MKMRKIPLRVCVVARSKSRKRNYFGLFAHRKIRWKSTRPAKNRVEACMSVPTRHVLKKRIKNIGWNGL